MFRKCHTEHFSYCASDYSVCSDGCLYHWTSRGLLPADADYNLLDVARRLEMYGMTLYPAKVCVLSTCSIL